MKVGNLIYQKKILVKRIMAILLICSISNIVNGANFYIATNGLSTNNGSITAPWSMAYGLSKYNLVPGDTVFVRGGEYLGQFVCNLGSGLPNNTANIVLKNYQNERVIIRDTTTTTGGAATFILNKPNTTIWGIEFTCNPNSLRYAIKAGSASNLKIINCIIHNFTNAGIGLGQDGKNNEIYGTIVCNGGFINDQGIGRGHGMYIQNTCEDSTRPKIIENCFIFNNCRNGLNIYSDDNYQCDIVAKDNVLFNGGEMGDTLAQPDRQLNFLCGGPAHGIARINVKENLFYRDTKGRNVKFGYGDLTINIDSSTYVENNYIANHFQGNTPPVEMRDFLTFFSFKRNTISSNSTNGFSWGEAGMDPNLIANYEWDYNNYHNVTSYDQYNQSAWLSAFGHDVNSTYDSGEPTNNFVKVVQNKYDLNRIHVSIVNWENLDDVIVDLNEFIPEGSMVKIYDVQNYLNGPYNTVIYSTINGLSFDMTLTEIMEITNGPSRNLVYVPPHTSKALGTFIVEFSGTPVNSIKTLEMGSKIFPNPSNGIIQIDLEYSFIIADAEYSIVDVQGHIMLNNNLTESKTTIDISHLPEGIYFIELKNKTDKFVKKISLIE